MSARVSAVQIKSGVRLNMEIAEGTSISIGGVTLSIEQAKSFSTALNRSIVNAEAYVRQQSYPQQQYPIQRDCADQMGSEP